VNNALTLLREKWMANRWMRRLILLFSVFGPATIAAMADNDASGVATYSIAGATLGYPILFLLVIVTILLAITQEMGMRLTLVARRGLADLIREKYGIKVSLFIFAGLLISNLGTIALDLWIAKSTSQMLGLPVIPVLLLLLLFIFLLVTRGNYKFVQSMMLIVSLFYLMYVISAIKAMPDWGLAFGNLLYPHGVEWTKEYTRNYLLIGMGVLGTTITPWGQFFISSFAFDKKMDKGKIIYSQLETYWGALITDIFSFFMIVATAATLFVHHIPLLSGEQAALAIEPFTGKLAGLLFALGMLNASLMGLVIIPLSTAYAFSEFFGLSGSLDTGFQKSKTFYTLFILQLALAAVIIFIPNISLVPLTEGTQILSAMILPLVFYYLIKLTSSKSLMGEYVNNRFQKNFTSWASVFIVIASAFTVAAVIFNW